MDKLHEAEAAGADGEQVEKLRARVEETNLKVQDAQRRLDELDNGREVASAARRVEHKLETPPRQLLEEKIDSLRQRIAASEKKLEELARAPEEDTRDVLPEEKHPEHYLRDDALAIWEPAEREALPDTGGRSLADAIRQTLEKQRKKLQEAEQQLAELEESGDRAPEPDDRTRDAAADAIARAQAKAKEREVMSPAEKVDAAIESLHGRIEKARRKLEAARAEGSEHVAALENGLEKLETKLAEAREERRQLGEPEPEPAPADDEPDDAAAAAIARAQAKAKERESMSPAQKLDANIESLQGRVEKARQKLEAAREEGSEHVDALENGLEKLETKLADAQQQRRQLDESGDAES